MLLSCLLLMAAPLQANGNVSDWESMHDARLLAAVDGDHRAAIGRLEELNARIESTDPLRGTIGLSLATFRYAENMVEGARDALSSARKFPGTAEQAISLASQIDALQYQIQVLPFRTGFSASNNPFVHAWAFPGRGSVDISLVAGEATLVWTSTVRDRQEDQILAVLSETGLPLHGLRCRVRGEGFPTWLRVLVVDDSDREFASEPFEVSVAAWKDLELGLSSFHHTDPTSPSIRPDPKHLVLLSFHDVTAYLSSDRGRREVWFDDVEIW